MVEPDAYMSTKALAKINKWLKFTQFWLLPGICVLCQQATHSRHDLCSACMASLERVPTPCFGCALTLPPGMAEPGFCGQCSADRLIHRSLAPLRWHGATIPLISGFKYHDKLVHGRVLTELLLQTLTRSYAPGTLPELMIPVPLHPKRLQGRGYNQAQLIARQLGAALQIPVAHQLVARHRATPPQQGLGATERRRNLRKAFTIGKPRQLASLTRIALVDDVVTTMSTVRVLAQALQSASPSPLEVHVWALARA